MADSQYVLPNTPAGNLLVTNTSDGAGMSPLPPLSQQGYSDPSLITEPQVRPSVDNFREVSLHAYGDDTAVMLCDLIYYLDSRGVFPSTESTSPIDVSELAPKQAYYYDSLVNLHKSSRISLVEGLYTWQDLQSPATLIDLALLTFTHQLNSDRLVEYLPQLKSLTENRLRVITLQDNSLKEPSVLDLTSYKKDAPTAHGWFEKMSLGSCGIPLPLLLVLLACPYITPTKEGIIQALQTDISLGFLRGAYESPSSLDS